MATNFHVGQKVVCVDDRWPSFRGTRSPIERGKVYTIDGFISSGGITPDGVWMTGTALLLREAENPEVKTQDIGFNPQRFRPVVERKTDISIFTDMLIKSKEPIEA